MSWRRWAMRIAAVPRWKRARYAVLLSLSLMYFIAYIDRTNISVAGPFISKELGLDKAAARLHLLRLRLSLYRHADHGRLARRPLRARVSSCSFSASSGRSAPVLTGMVGGAVSLVLVRLLVGIGEGGAFPAATRAMTFWFPPQERGLAQGVTHSFARLGGAVAPSPSSASWCNSDGAPPSSCSAP